MRQVLGPGELGRPRGIGWRGRWKGGSGWGIHVTTPLIHVNVWQNPLKCCEVISLQLIKINEKKFSSFLLFFFLQRLACYCLVTKLCPTRSHPHRLRSTRVYCPWDFPSKNTGVGCHFLFQGIFLTRDWTHISCLAGIFFTIESPGKSLSVFLSSRHIVSTHFNWI